jgi:histidine ammonia-lyase
MTVVLARRADITLDSFARVAWEGEDVAVAPEALAEIARRRQQLLAFVAANPRRKLYGVNVPAGDGSDRLMTEAEQRDYERGLHAGTSFGEALPFRVVRGIVFCRLANFIDGHAGVSAELTQAVAARLDGRPLAPVPRYGNGGPGEIQALGWLFDDLPGELTLGLKEGMALINGSPCASALLADAVLTTSVTLEVAESVFCLACAAAAVPPATFDPALDQLWGDRWQAEALRALRAGLTGADSPPGGAEHPQPAVSFRILPRVLGNARRAVAVARDAATVALSAVSDNPVFLFPSGEDDLGDLVSNGGFHSGTAPSCIDSLAFALADLAQLAQHHIQRLQTSPVAHPGLDSLALGTMQMVANGYAEEARAAAVPSLLPLAGFGQNDAPAPTFLAWNRHDRVRGFVGGSITCLAAMAAQALARPGRSAPPSLAGLLADVLSVLPPVTERRFLGQELSRLTAVVAPYIPD